ncbi:MAG: CoA transferase [Peptococcaceae bacterium]|nr:MAG: CoA transferase [Peptococcaceae bacterium]
MSPLEGVRVIDLSNFLPAPFASLILADLGAEVIKIERPPAGDHSRSMVFEGFFEAINRSKKSLTLDLKQERGKEILARLIEKSDVFLEASRPGVMARYGFGYGQVSKMNEKIIYCSLSGFGQDGPYRDVPAHDVNPLAVSGLLSLLGNPQGPPAPWSGTQIADLCSGMYAALSIVAALSERKESGRGDCLDVSMSDCMLAWMGPRIGEYFGRGKPSKEKFLGRGAYGPFETKDGKYLAIACVENHYWIGLCRLLGIEHIAHKKEYDGWMARVERANEINPVLVECFLQKDYDEWMALLRKENIPCSPVNFIDDLENDPQIKHRQMLRFSDGRPVVDFPVKFNRIRLEKPGPVPRLGEHNEEILGFLGYGKEEIAGLRESKIII